MSTIDKIRTALGLCARQIGDDALQVDDLAVRVLALLAERDELRARLDVPNGWRLVSVKSAEFDALMYWMDRCESKGHMDRCSDLIEPWGAFEYAEVAAPEHKAPAGGCGACGDACVNRRRCRLAEESPEHKS